MKGNASGVIVYVVNPSQTHACKQLLHQFHFRYLLGKRYFIRGLLLETTLKVPKTKMSIAFF